MKACKAGPHVSRAPVTLSFSFSSNKKAPHIWWGEQWAIQLGLFESNTPSLDSNYLRHFLLAGSHGKPRRSQSSLTEGPLVVLWNLSPVLFPPMVCDNILKQLIFMFWFAKTKGKVWSESPHFAGLWKRYSGHGSYRDTTTLDLCFGVCGLWMKSSPGSNLQKTHCRPETVFEWHLSFSTSFYRDKWLVHHVWIIILSLIITCEKAALLSHSFCTEDKYVFIYALGYQMNDREYH